MVCGGRGNNAHGPRVETCVVKNTTCSPADMIADEIDYMLASTISFHGVDHIIYAVGARGWRPRREPPIIHDQDHTHKASSVLSSTKKGFQ
jgi:hypothetical protein